MIVFLYNFALSLRRWLPNFLKMRVFGMPRGFADIQVSGGSRDSINMAWKGEASLRQRPHSPDQILHWKFDLHLAGDERFSHEHPDVWCVQLQDSIVFGFNGAVVDSEGVVVSPGFEQPFEDAGNGVDVRKLLLPKSKPLRGYYMLIDCPSGGSNIFHWLTEALPRIAIIRRYTHRNPVALVRDQLSLFSQDSLRKLGIEWRVISRNEAIRPECLLLTSMPGYWGNPPPFAVQFLRESFLASYIDKCHKPSERIFVVRRATRRVLNENEITPILDRFGIKKVVLEELSFEEQVGLFQSAELVVAPHGAGLTNIVFCQEGANVIEFFSPNYVNVCFWALANQVGLKYSYLIGEGERPPIGTDPHLIRDDIVVPVRQFEDWLSQYPHW